MQCSQCEEVFDPIFEFDQESEQTKCPKCGTSLSQEETMVAMSLHRGITTDSINDEDAWVFKKALDPNIHYAKGIRARDIIIYLTGGKKDEQFERRLLEVT